MNKLTVLLSALALASIVPIGAQTTVDCSKLIKNAGFEIKNDSALFKTKSGYYTQPAGWTLEKYSARTTNNWDASATYTSAVRSGKYSFFIRNNWVKGNEVVFSQTVYNLPDGTYTLKAFCNPNNADLAKGSVMIIAGTDTVTSPQSTVANDWNELSATVTLPANVDSITVKGIFDYYGDGNSGAANVGSISFDDFMLQYTGNDPMPVLKVQLAGLVEEAESLKENELANYIGLASYLGDAIIEFGDAGSDVATTQANCDSLNAKIIECNKAITAIPQLKALIDECQTLVSQTSYPGADAFNEALDAAASVYENTDKSLTDDYLNAITSLQNAKLQYRLSQTATKDTPANYTFMVQHPWFCVDGYEPKSIAAADLKASQLSAKVESSAGWVNGSTSKGGDQRVNYTDCTCWNAWAVNFPGYLDIHQDLTNLPNGLYGIKCYGKTQPGCINDQHAYVKTALQTVASPIMTMDNATWEQLNTAATGYAIVSDGNLTIGMTGTHDASKVSGSAADGRNGWFQSTGYELDYYGPSTLDDVKKVYADKLASCQAEADTMIFKGDKATLQKVITDNTGKESEADIYAALKNLTDAQDSAAISINRQKSIFSGIYKQIGDSITANAYDENMLPIMQNALTFAQTIVNAEGQTSDCYNAIVASLTAYAKTYAPTYSSAVYALNTFSSEAGINAVNGTLQSQLKAFTDSLLSSTTVTAMANYLKEALTQAKTCDLMELGVTDYTSIIVNPNCEQTSSTGLAGWTITHTASANTSNIKQQFDGNAAGRYIDSYYATVGGLLFNAHQTLTNIPNGTYKLKAYCRTSGTPGTEGTYLYTIADNDSVNGVKLAMVKRPLTNITEITSGQFKKADGTDSIAYATANLYGDVWMAAAKSTNYGASGSVDDLAIYGVNASKGYGWQNMEIEAEVKNHVLTIGITTDSTFTVGYKDLDGNACIPFTGTWISADNFSLTLTANGNNTDWSPVTAIKDLKTDDSTDNSYRIYNLNGVQMNASSAKQKGIYIVKTKNSVKKIVIR
jgi:hypothetical protein